MSPLGDNSTGSISKNRRRVSKECFVFYSVKKGQLSDVTWSTHVQHRPEAGGLCRWPWAAIVVLSRLSLVYGGMVFI